MIKNYDSSKAIGSYYKKGDVRYLSEGHHNTVVAMIRDGKSSPYMGLYKTENVPELDYWWYKEWYEFWKKSIKVVE